MKTNIPILILMINDSEFDLYRNEKFLPFTKSYLETYGLYRNSIFICNDEKEPISGSIGIIRGFWKSSERDGDDQPQ